MRNSNFLFRYFHIISAENEIWKKFLFFFIEIIFDIFYKYLSPEKNYYKLKILYLLLFVIYLMFPYPNKISFPLIQIQLKLKRTQIPENVNHDSWLFLEIYI